MRFMQLGTLARRLSFSHDVKQRSVLRSRGALLRPGFVLVIASIPQEAPRRGVGGAPTGALFHLSR
jgi:hypothetical protein